MARRRSRRRKKEDALAVVGGIILLLFLITKHLIVSIQNFYDSLSVPNRVVLWGAIALCITAVVQIMQFIRKMGVQRRVRQMRQNLMYHNTLQQLLMMSSTEFEHYVADIFRLMGYTAKVTRRTGDGGKDIILNKDGETSLVECKLYSTTKVGRRDIQVFHSAVIDASAKQGFFVTTGYFAKTVQEYVKDKPIRLIDRNALLALIHKVSV